MGDAPARISVVVPAYNVAAYLETCLGSLAQQTLADLEVVVVDDGSADASPEIAERFAARDERFRLVRQANAGLGAARNIGIDHCEGELLAFVDGDDIVPRHAYEVLSRALDRTGSDFATGNVRRLTSLGTTRATFLGDAFERERLATHITRFPDLVADRLACNKLFRRSFWERHGLRFPEGVRNEDIPVVLPAHYLAGSVDVLAQTVYLWRRREGGDLSGSQRRAGMKALRDRVRAVDYVSRFLAGRGLAEAKLIYDRSVLGNDVRYFLDVLDTADEDFRHLFLDLVGDFLDRADPAVLEQPLAIERLKWHLVRRRALPELLDVVAFQAERLPEMPPVRRLRRWYGDYPYRGDRRLAIPSSVYRLDDELAPVVRLESVRWDGEKLRIQGHAYIEMIGAPRRRSQKVEVVARRAGPPAEQVLLETKPVRRPDVTAGARQQLVSLDWSGFAATLDARRLWSAGRWRRGSWRIGFVVRAGGVVRESWTPEPAPLRAPPAAELSADGVRVRVELTQDGELELRVQRNPSLVHSYSVDEEVLRLEGAVGALTGAESRLRIVRRDGGASLDYPVENDRGGASFVARVPLADLVVEPDVADRAAHAEEQGEGIAWDLFLVGEKGRRRLALDEAAPETIWGIGGRELVLERTRHGNASILERTFRPVVRDAEWSPAGALILAGSFRGPPGDYELVLRPRRGGEAYGVPLAFDAAAGRFAAELSPGRVGSLAGERPLAEGRWELLVRRGGSARSTAVSVLLGHELVDRLPIAATIGHKLCRFGVLGYDLAVLAVERDLDDDERGGFHQRCLRTELYGARRRGGLRDAVLYECFGGREYSDSPRAIHEELVRRESSLEHLWVVRDGACSAPETAVAVRELSEEYYEAYASARYVVANDHWPRWAARRPEQIWLQTWHGAPLKRLGHDLAGRPKAVREYRRVLRQPSESWQYLVSPGAFATPILRRAFAPDAEVLETGLPRTDVLLRPDRDRLADGVRRRLGLAPGKRVVLYAPTYRDQLVTGDRYRLGPLLDLAALCSGLGEDYVLFRKHRLVVGTLPEEAGGSVLDVSEFPDATELLLAVDVLVTDYSSAIFDFAVTGRPILFFTPDLETYRDEIRGFSIDFEAEAPGPLLRTTAEVVEALRELDGVRAAYRKRYERFVAAHCTLADGAASSRVVEQIFGR